ncbi:MAG: SDR family oxidoreductase [Mucilaginibacter polytrichastri]|nr:SDR family oxidoreductase [Mucilaginibacter polytrichastri]
MILITGASGQLGSKTIDHVLKKGIDPSDITGLVRDPDKGKELITKGIRLKKGDYNDHASLVEAFTGISKLLLVSSNDRQAVENRTAHHINVINAAKEAGVQHVVYTSFVRKPGYQDSAIAGFQNAHVQSEDYLKSSGIPYTILQNGIYMEMIPVFAGEKVMESGVVVFPAGTGRASYVLREELAEAAAHVLTTAGHENRIYPLTNTRSVSFQDIAGGLSALSGKEIRYQSPAVHDFEAMLKSYEVPDQYIGMFSMWGTALSQGTMDVEDATLSRFLGRAPMTVEEFLKTTYTGR